MSKSHTVYAARRWWHTRDEAWFARVDRGLPSEGEWRDLLVDSERTHAELDAAVATATQLANAALTREQQLEKELATIEAALVLADTSSEQPMGRHDDDILKARPGGIVRDRYSEAARNITVTAEAYQAALARKREREQASTQRQALRTRAAALRTELGLVAQFEPPPLPDLPRSVFEPHFTELRDLCDKHGADLLIVMLPFDVQVSSAEWAKYGVEDGPDLSPTLALLDDAVASATKLGIPALDVTAALRAAEPGAFLDGDIHMTPKGHAAFADALAHQLRSPPEPAKAAAHPAKPTKQSKSPEPAGPGPQAQIQQRK
jgi:nucleotide-binding universal stress UspA family protein